MAIPTFAGDPLAHRLVRETKREEMVFCSMARDRGKRTRTEDRFCVKF